MHDIISDILDWDEAHKAYVADEGETGERFDQRLEAADLMAEIEARWQHLPGGFHRERKRIKTHIQAVADEAPTMSVEELCWLAIAAASAWIPSPVQVREAPRRSSMATQVMCFAVIIGALVLGPSPMRANIAKSTPSQVCATFGSDERTAAVTRALLADGTAWMSGSRWRGQTVLRVSVSNWSTTVVDVAKSLAALRRAVEAVDRE